MARLVLSQPPITRNSYVNLNSDFLRTQGKAIFFIFMLFYTLNCTQNPCIICKVMLSSRTSLGALLGNSWQLLWSRVWFQSTRLLAGDRLPIRGHSGSQSTPNIKDLPSQTYQPLLCSSHSLPLDVQVGTSNRILYPPFWYPPQG